MSEKVLSQDEIDALLDAVSDGEGAVGPAGAVSQEDRDNGRGRGTLFPLVKTRALTKEVQTALSIIYDTFAHKGSSTLTTTLRTQVGFNPEPMEQIIYSEFIELLPEPSSLWYLQLKPYGLHVALCLEPALVHAIISVMLGGGNTAEPGDRKNVTDLEQSVTETVVLVFCRELEHAWSRVAEVQITIDNRETRPRLLQIYPPRDGFVMLPMKMKVGAIEGGIYWGIPSPLLKILESNLLQQSQAENREKLAGVVQKIKSKLLNIPTKLEARLSDTMVVSEDLLNMKEGQILKLEHRVDSPIRIRVNGSEKFLGQVVHCNDRRAVKIAGSVEQN
ncbi:MAG: flagellar motor switch protein FliM [bacterium]